MSQLRGACEQVLRDNDRGRYTVPAPGLSPDQSAWDSSCAAIGWAHVDAGRACTELATLMEAQWDDGRVPHAIFHDPDSDGPNLWGTERSSSISHPPLWATAARRILSVNAELDGRATSELIPRFEASHRFFHEQRDPKSWGAIAVAHPWESSLDDSPAWDAAMARVDGGALGLARAIADDGFGPGPFAVYDPMLTAILARAEDDLA
jgi:hypothetical protein